jgi:hypothetical protein
MGACERFTARHYATGMAALARATGALGPVATAPAPAPSAPLAVPQPPAAAAPAPDGVGGAGATEGPTEGGALQEGGAAAEASGELAGGDAEGGEEGVRPVTDAELCVALQLADCAAEAQAHYGGYNPEPIIWTKYWAPFPLPR